MLLLSRVTQIPLQLTRTRIAGDTKSLLCISAPSTGGSGVVFSVFNMGEGGEGKGEGELGLFATFQLGACVR